MEAQEFYAVIRFYAAEPVTEDAARRELDRVLRQLSPRFIGYNIELVIEIKPREGKQ